MPDARRKTLEDLIARIAKGDRRAFDALYQATSARLNAVCLALLRDRREAEEVLEQAYIRIWKKARDFENSGLSPMAWLVTLAREEGMKRLRNGEASPIGAGDIQNPLQAVRIAYLHGLDLGRFAESAAIPVEAAQQRLHEELAGLGALDRPDDLLAAELALGLPDGPAADAAQSRLATDPGFAQQVRDWEERLARLADDLTPVMAPARAWQRIRESLGHGLAPLSVDPLERTPWWRGTGGILTAIVLAAALGWYLWTT